MKVLVNSVFRISCGMSKLLRDPDFRDCPEINYHATSTAIQLDLSRSGSDRLLWLAGPVVNRVATQNSFGDS